MRTSVAGFAALRKMRKQLEEDAGDAFPEAVFTEILTLYDVCHALQMNVFQIREVMGNRAMVIISKHLDTIIVPVKLGEISDSDRELIYQ